MKVIGLNHITLAVRDLERSIAFYTELLGFSIRMRAPASAYLEAGALWLALVADREVRAGPLPEYSHIAFSVTPSDMQGLSDRLRAANALRWQESNSAESFYFLDPDGHKLELHSGDLGRRLSSRAVLREPGVVLYNTSSNPPTPQNHVRPVQKEETGAG